MSSLYQNEDVLLWKKFLKNENGMDPARAGPLCWSVYHQLSLSGIFLETSPSSDFKKTGVQEQNEKMKMEQFIEMTTLFTLLYYCAKCRSHFEQVLARNQSQLTEQTTKENTVKIGCFVHNMVNQNLNKKVYSEEEIERFCQSIQNKMEENIRQEQLGKLSNFENEFILFLFLVCANFPAYFSGSLPRHQLLHKKMPEFLTLLLDLVPTYYSIGVRIRENQTIIQKIIDETRNVKISYLEQSGREFYLFCAMKLTFYLCPQMIQKNIQVQLGASPVSCGFCLGSNKNNRPLEGDDSDCGDRISIFPLMRKFPR